MCKIQIKRDSGWADRVRNYKVLVDDVEIGEIGNGKIETYNLEPGQHTLQLTIDWCSSNEIAFELAPRETMKFSCGSSLRGSNIFRAAWVAFFQKDSYIWLRASGS